MKKHTVMATFLTIAGWAVVGFLSCKKDGPVQPPAPSIQLTAEGGASTDVLLRMKLTDSAGPKGVALLRDGQAVLTLQLRTSDSLIIDEGLAPRHTYTYKAVRLQDTTAVDVSAPVQVTTMDTTSHDWVFDQPVLLGDGGSSVFYDCQIINDTLAYAVGEIYLLDSTGHVDPIHYNLAVWNGRQWHCEKLRYQGVPPVTRCVFAVTERDVWFDPWFHWDGEHYTEIPIDPNLFGVTWIKMWGRPQSEMYIVGDGGAIASSADHGITWQRVESGTTETINDVWGGSNPLLGENVVMAAAGTPGMPGSQTKLLLLRASSMHADTLPWQGMSTTRSSVWFDRNSRIYTCGRGVYVSSNDGWRRLSDLPAVYTWMVRGNGPNDIMVCGEDGLLMHFNGSTWRIYPEVSLSFGRFYSVAIKGNLVVAVGWLGNRAVSVVGHR